MSEIAAHSVVIHTVGTVNAVKLGGITSMAMPMNTETVSDDSGQRHDHFRAISKQSPVPTATTKSVMLALQALTPDGACIDTDASHPGAKFFFEQKQICQQAAVGTGDHTQYLVDAGFMSPQQLSASIGEDVTLSMAFDALTSAGNAPLVSSYAATLPTGVDTSQFVLGAMKVAGIPIPDVRSLNIEFGIELTDKTPQLGGVWSEQVGLSKARPSASLTAKTPDYWKETGGIPGLGKPAQHADTIFYFKKRKNRAAFEDDVTAVHFAITMSGLTLIENAISASGTSTGDISIKIEGINDGVNAPLILTPNIAYDPSP